MKLLKQTCFVALTLIMGGNVLVSCSADNETIDNPTAKDAEIILKSGRGDEFTLTEIFIGTSARPAGYMVSETATSQAVSYLDLTGTTFAVTTFDPATQNVQRFSSSEAFYSFYNDHEFQPIRVITDPGFQEPDPGQPVTLGKRYSYGSPTYGPDGCTQGVYEASYVLGIRVSKVKQTMITNENGNYVQAQVPCGEEYDPA